MIQPGQKLKEGDWCKVDSKQADQLWNIQNGFDLSCSFVEIIIFLYGGLLWNERPDDECLTEYNFADFKQLCENTFKQ